MCATSTSTKNSSLSLLWEALEEILRALISEAVIAETNTNRSIGQVETIHLL
jgi:hypothetical protein